MQPIIEAQNLSRIGTDGRILLQPTTLSLSAGDKIGIAGDSGSGKSVLLRTLALLDWPNQGTVIFKGQVIRSATQVAAYRIQAAYIRQQAVMVSGSVADNLLLPFRLKNYRNRKPDQNAILSMLAQINRDETFLQRDATTLSGGEMQLVALIRILQLNPQVLFLDEPTAALDNHTAQAVEMLVNRWHAEQPNRAYAWISHQPEQLHRIAKKIWTVQQGQVFQGALSCTTLP